MKVDQINNLTADDLQHLLYIDFGVRKEQDFDPEAYSAYLEDLVISSLRNTLEMIAGLDDVGMGDLVEGNLSYGIPAVAARSYLILQLSQFQKPSPEGLEKVKKMLADEGYDLSEVKE